MKNIFTEDREIKEPKLYQALISFAGLVVVMSIGIIIFKQCSIQNSKTVRVVVISNINR